MSKNRNYVILLKSYQFIREFRLLVLLSIVLMITTMCLSILQPLIFGSIIDTVNKKNIPEFTKLTLFLITILFMHITIQFFQGNLQILIASKIEISLKKKVFRSILDLRMKTFEQMEKGKLINHIESDIQTFSNMFTDKISIFVDFISIVFVTILIFRIDFHLTILLFLTFPLTSLIFSIFGKRIKKEEIKLKTNLDSYFTFIQECLNNFKLIKVTGSEDKQSSKYINVNQSLYKIGIRKRKLNIFGTSLSQFVNSSSYIGIIILGVNKIIIGHLSIGSLVTFNSYSSTLTNSLMRIAHLNSELQEVMVSIQRLDEITNSLDRESEKSGTLSIDQIHSLQIKNLYFQYQNSLDYTFSNLSLNLNENGLYYISGKSGSGKTTLLNLVAGLYTDYNGGILINNQEIHTLSLHSYRKRICYILQESNLFSTSIMENLTLLNEEVTEEEIYSVCTRLNIHETILNLPQSYHTKIGADGVLLSEGQKQRISIARAILKKADIYLCDEISSSLDKENQQLVTEILHQLARDSIVLTVSHHSVYEVIETVAEFKGYDNQIRISKVIDNFHSNNLVVNEHFTI